jgi:hypothetical protein
VENELPENELPENEFSSTKILAVTANLFAVFLMDVYIGE